MKVIFGKTQAESIGDRMTLLELDTFFQPGLEEPITAYAVLDNTAIPLQELPVLSNFVELHNNLMAEYRKRNWNYVEHAIEHLQGRWKGELDSFYEEILARVKKLKEINLPDAWNGIVINNFT
jgi:AAA+ ATPase superfamily predicted ATPase